MSYIHCNLNGGDKELLDGLTVKNSGGTTATAHQPSGGWSGTTTGSGTITIQFPKTIDLSQYNVSGGTVNGNDISVAYTIKMTGSAGYYNASCTSNDIALTKK